MNVINGIAVSFDVPADFAGIPLKAELFREIEGQRFLRQGTLDRWERERETIVRIVRCEEGVIIVDWSSYDECTERDHSAWWAITELLVYAGVLVPKMANEPAFGIWDAERSDGSAAFPPSIAMGMFFHFGEEVYAQQYIDQVLRAGSLYSYRPRFRE